MKNEKDSNGPGESEFDFLGFGSLFKGIEKLVDLASKLEQTGAINREGEMNLDHLKKGMKGVYGFTIKSAVGGGSPKVETFGNIVKTRKFISQKAPKYFRGFFISYMIKEWPKLTGNRDLTKLAAIKIIVLKNKVFHLVSRKF